MQRLSPNVEYEENRTAWLLRGQKCHPDESRFVDLLTAELRADSHLCIDPSTREFAANIRQAEQRMHYLKVRWDGIGRRGSWNSLAEEIDLARPLFGLDQTELWVHLLVDAYEIVSFSNDTSGGQLLKTIHEEIKSFPDLELTLAEDLESLDFWQFVRRQRTQTGIPTNEIFTFISQYRQLDPAETRLALLGVIRRWIDRPRVGLNLLTSTSANYPEAFWQFLRYVAIADTADEDFDDETLDREVADFFPETYSESYAGMRYRILDFCRDECVGPRQFFHHLGNVANDIQVSPELLNAFDDDYPLYLTIKCVHLFLKATSGDVVTGY